MAQSIKFQKIERLEDSYLSLCFEMLIGYNILYIFFPQKHSSIFDVTFRKSKNHHLRLINSFIKLLKLWQQRVSFYKPSSKGRPTSGFGIVPTRILAQLHLHSWSRSCSFLSQLFLLISLGLCLPTIDFPFFPCMGQASNYCDHGVVKDRNQEVFH